VEVLAAELGEFLSEVEESFSRSEGARTFAGTLSAN